MRSSSHDVAGITSGAAGQTTSGTIAGNAVTSGTIAAGSVTTQGITPDTVTAGAMHREIEESDQQLRLPPVGGGRRL